MDIALFSPSSLFHDDDDTTSTDEETTDSCQTYVERTHQFHSMELVIREFSFHQMNANLLWPGTFAFVEWCISYLFEEAVGITTSDYDDQEIEDNIAHNCRVNGVTPVLPHIKHSWGDPFPNPHPEWDLIIANVKQYPNLIKTLCFLLNSYKTRETTTTPQAQGCLPELAQPAFLMSWRRRIGKEDESLFFTGCETAGLQVKHLGTRVEAFAARFDDLSARIKPFEKYNRIKANRFCDLLSDSRI
ncbi:LOW QUALITY PROTEIN: hypothetical protein M8C21_022154 [Ambrosia artemisiifolia]|uniref:Uncharacterized protein n=1 Tax=Ambrosia artemisiifolia TaxID=4212 RepID=A0AAD5C0H3_AMBAR|nr:LOW QUALITY PROTEIN: hypothetical protein M8C21_022154 [Ambrosia artemisiifolia]